MKFARILDAITAAAVVAIAGALVVQQAERWGRSAAPPATRGPIALATGWQEVIRGFRSEGDGPIILAVFTDYECPFCATFHARLDSLAPLQRRRLRVVVVPFPLPTHQHAIPAAIAAECAASQGRFEAMERVLYERQRGFGLSTWTDYAQRASVPDTTAFSNCMQRPASSFPLIQAGAQLASAAHIQATPTVWLDGIQLPHAPSLAELRKRLQ